MGTVSEDTLFTNVFQEVYSYLNSNLTNPHTTGQWIYSAFPTKRIDEDDLYPILIITPAEIVNQEMITFRIMNLRVNVTIEPFSAAAEQIDSISSNIFKYMNSSTNLRTTKLEKVRLVNSSSTTEIKIKNKKIHTKSITFQMDFHYTI